MSCSCRIVSVVLLIWTALSEAAELQGRVVNGEGQPMPNATVYLDEMSRATTSDLKGEFIFDNITPDSYRLTVSFIGYKTVVMAIAVEEGHMSVEVRMEEETVRLGEVVVLPEGMEMEEYLLRQMNCHATTLKKKLDHFEAQVTYRLEKDIDLSHMPKRRTIRAAAWMMGYARIMDALVQNKYLKLVLTERLTFNKGKMAGTEPQMVEMVPRLSRKQAAAFLKHDKLLRTNVYDGLYKKIKKKTGEMLEARKKGNPLDFSYVGSYTFEDRTIYVVKFGDAEAHLVDGCWQVLRIQYMQGENRMYYEFRNRADGIFLPISGFAEFHFNSESFPNGSVGVSCAFSYY